MVGTDLCNFNVLFIFWSLLYIVAMRIVSISSVNNFAIINSKYKDKNNNKFKNRLVIAFRNMKFQCYIHKMS